MPASRAWLLPVCVRYNLSTPMRALPVVLLLLLWTVPAWASSIDPRVAYLTRQLRTAQDARVRAQAALVLGKSEEVAALPPLCEGLKDESGVVRGAAARGLEELQELDAIPCLQGALEDRDPSVRTAATKAYKSLTTIRDRQPWLYVAMRPMKVADSFDAELGPMAEARLKRRLGDLGVRWVPDAESKAAAKKVLAKQKLMGVVLMPELVAHGDKGLRMKVLCLSYPDERLLGQVEVKASGGRPVDLVKALVPHAITQMADIFEESRN